MTAEVVGPATVIDRRYSIPVKYAGEPAVRFENNS